MIGSGFVSGDGRGFLLGGQLGDESGEELFLGGAGGGQLRFQFVHQSHQLIHLGYDAALFGEETSFFAYLGHHVPLVAVGADQRRGNETLCGYPLR